MGYCKQNLEFIKNYPYDGVEQTFRLELSLSMEPEPFEALQDLIVRAGRGDPEAKDDAVDTIYREIQGCPRAAEAIRLSRECLAELLSYLGEATMGDRAKGG